MSADNAKGKWFKRDPPPGPTQQISISAPIPSTTPNEGPISAASRIAAVGPAMTASSSSQRHRVQNQELPISARFATGAKGQEQQPTIAKLVDDTPQPYPHSRGGQTGTAQDAMDKLTGRVDNTPPAVTYPPSSTSTPNTRGDYNSEWKPPKQSPQQTSSSALAPSALPLTDMPSQSRRLAPPGWRDSDASSAYPDSETSTAPAPGTPPRGPIAVPRFDHRGYPVKAVTGLAASNVSSPHSSRSLPSRPQSSTDDFTRYPYESDHPLQSLNPSPNRTRPTPALAAAPGADLATDVATYYGNEKHDSESIESHHSGRDQPPESGLPGVRWAEAPEPTPNGSFSSASSSNMDHRGQMDFDMKKKIARRHIVSMLDDPMSWAYLGPEDDDDFHNPDVKSKQKGWFKSLATVRGFTNIGCVFMLLLILVVVFAGYPVLTATLTKPMGSFGGFNIGGTNASGQLPDVGPFQLIDRDTPHDAYYWTSYETGEKWELVFSDEFNRDGRTFYEGDDPYWQAEDIHYWGTNNLNWYDPGWIKTANGSLVIRLDWMDSHDLPYVGGLMTTWNRFCFTGGYIETKVMLPGKNSVLGLWPAVWTLGNLGRAGYGGTLEGMWPYTYDSCDVGTLKNQSLNGVPSFTAAEGDIYDKVKHGLSYLPGQRLSRCTCKSEGKWHPGPKHSDGTFVGRGAPEIDIFEAQISQDDADGDHTGVWSGHVSMSAQWAPFNPGYQWLNGTPETSTIYVDNEHGWLNSYQGGVQQQSTSALIKTDQKCYELEGGCFSVYGFEYAPGSDGYITWTNNAEKAWTVRAAAMGPNARAMVQGRPVPEEPMYIIMNLGISQAFGGVDFENLNPLFPVEMHVDYVRVYQDPAKKNIGCDPTDFPTQAYINQHLEAYYNPNITTYAQVAEKIPDLHWPLNNLIDGCE